MKYTFVAMQEIDKDTFMLTVRNRKGMEKRIRFSHKAVQKPFYKSPFEPGAIAEIFFYGPTTSLDKNLLHYLDYYGIKYTPGQPELVLGKNWYCYGDLIGDPQHRPSFAQKLVYHERTFIPSV